VLGVASTAAWQRSLLRDQWQHGMVTPRALAATANASRALATAHRATHPRHTLRHRGHANTADRLAACCQRALDAMPSLALDAQVDVVAAPLEAAARAIASDHAELLRRCVLALGDADADASSTAPL